MRAQHSTAPASIPADQIILALQRLDADGKEAVLSIIMTAAKHARWIRKAIQEAVAQQLSEQRSLDAWIEEEEEKHSNMYACESMKH